MENLNEWRLNYYGSENSRFSHSPNNNSESENGAIKVYFRDLEFELIDKIVRYPIAVGCVAWLTNTAILNALSTRFRASVIIQKEDFLRPDSGNWSGQNLRSLYASLPPGVSQFPCSSVYWGETIEIFNQHSGWESEAVRWVGNFNTERKPAFPRMHNKFLVFCELELIKSPPDCYWMGGYHDDRYDEHYRVIPSAVWTGSFNFTDNGTRSLENALFIKDQNIVNAYYEEWQHIFGLSESIPNEFWAHRWSPPEFFWIGS